MPVLCPLLAIRMAKSLGKDIAKFLGYGDGNASSKAMANAIKDHVEEEDKRLIPFSELKGLQNGDLKKFSHNGEPWFVGKDVTGVLGYSNSRKALADHVDDEDKGVTKCDTLGGAQDLAVINESGLYSLIFNLDQK